MNWKLKWWFAVSYSEVYFEETTTKYLILLYISSITLVLKTLAEFKKVHTQCIYYIVQRKQTSVQRKYKKFTMWENYYMDLCIHAFTQY